jgi:hypothetical protein
VLVNFIFKPADRISTELDSRRKEAGCFMALDACSAKTGFCDYFAPAQDLSRHGSP